MGGQFKRPSTFVPAILGAFTWQPIFKISLPERLDRQYTSIRRDRVLRPIVIVSLFHAQL